MCFSDQLIISRATVTGLIDSLERRGYVQRMPHQSDKRMILVTITDAGQQVAEDFRPIVHDHQKAWFEVLSETDQLRLIDSLHRLQAVFMELD